MQMCISYLRSTENYSHTNTLEAYEEIVGQHECPLECNVYEACSSFFGFCSHSQHLQQWLTHSPCSIQNFNYLNKHQSCTEVESNS